MKDISNLLGIGAGVYIFTKAYPLIQGLVTSLGSIGAPGPAGPVPLSVEQTRDIFATELGGLEALRADVARALVQQTAAASVIPDTNIGVGQQDLAVLDANARIGQLQEQLNALLAGQVLLGQGQTPPAVIETYTAPVSGYNVPVPYQPQPLPPVEQLQTDTYTIDRPVQTVVARPHTAPGQTATFNVITQQWTVS